MAETATSTVTKLPKAMDHLLSILLILGIFAVSAIPILFFEDWDLP